MTNPSESTNEPSCLSLRAAKMQRQREQLIEAGLELFLRRGFEATSVTDIVEKVSISPRTFFRYFKTKEDLVFDWSEANGRFAVGVLQARAPEQSPMESMKAMLRLLADRNDADRHRNMRLTRLIYESPTLSTRAHYAFSKWENAFVHALTEGRKLKTQEKFGIKVVVAVTVTAYVIALQQWARNRRATSLRPLVLGALDILH